MSLGLIVHGVPWPQLVGLAKACEDAGIDAIGLIESPLLDRDVYLACAACALGTSRTRIMTTVTNPVTRHPSVTAAAMLALADLAPRRVTIGIGPGDSALWSVGLKPATIAELRDYVVALKALSRGEEAQWRGQSFRRTWAGWSDSIDVPIYVACAGPKGLRSAVPVADGVIVSMGFATEDIANVRRLIEEGCAEVGRRPDELDVWWYSEVTFAESLEAAMESGFRRFAQWLTMGSMAHKRIPEPLGPLLRELMGARHDIGT